MLGKGNYDNYAQELLINEEASAVIMIVINGKQGHGMACKCYDDKIMEKIPDILHYVAEHIKPELEADIKAVEAIKKGDVDAKSTTEDSGPQSFAG